MKSLRSFIKELFPQNIRLAFFSNKIDKHHVQWSEKLFQDGRVML